VRSVILILLSFISLSAYAAGTLEQRMYYYSEQSKLLRTICFDPNGKFLANAIFVNHERGFRSTAIDCNGQVLALEKERKEIEAEVQNGGPSCGAEIRDANLIALMSGMDDVSEQLECPGVGSLSNCMEGLACNLATSAVPLLGVLQSAGELPRCGQGDGNCLFNLLKGAFFNVKDTACGLSSLFGYSCDEEPKLDPEAASSDAAIVASFQNEASVTSFRENPFLWMKQKTSVLLAQIGDQILQRFGCAEWENPSAPFGSQCKKTVSFGCADCSTKANMVCGVVGYISGELAVSFFTGAAAGIVSRAAVKIAGTSEHLFTAARATRAGSIVARVGARGFGSVGSAWKTISASRLSAGLKQAADAVLATGAKGVTAANAFARKNIFLIAKTQDATLAAAEKFGKLAEASFMLGFRSTGAARSATVNAFETTYLKVSDIKSGQYASQGIRTPEDYFKFATKNLTPEDRSHMRLVMSNDQGDSRLMLLDSRATDFDPSITVNFNAAPPVDLHAARVSASTLSNEGRVSEASRVLGDKALTERQRSALIEAHEVGDGRGLDLGELTAGRETYTQEDKIRKALILRRAGFTQEEARVLLDRGIAGGLGDITKYRRGAVEFQEGREALIDSKSTLSSIANLRSRSETADVSEHLNLFRAQSRTAADGFFQESLRARSPLYMSESWRLSVRAGDASEALMTMQRGVKEFQMAPEKILGGLDHEISRLRTRLSSSAEKGNPALELELKTYKDLRARAEQTFAPKPAPQKISVEALHPPSPPPTPVQATAPTPTPPVPVAAAPGPTQLRAPEGTPRQRIIDQANNYRLGREGKPRDADRAAALYYQADESVIASEISRLRRSTGESEFFKQNNNLSKSFTESFMGTGVSARAMVDDVFTKGGAHNVNLFLLEIQERGLSSVGKDPTARKNMVDFAKHVQEKYGSDLYNHQKQYVRDWIRSNDW
jgi:hypothetical protein